MSFLCLRFLWKLARNPGSGGFTVVISEGPIFSRCLKVWFTYIKSVDDSLQEFLATFQHANMLLHLGPTLWLLSLKDDLPKLPASATHWDVDHHILGLDVPFLGDQILPPNIPPVHFLSVKLDSVPLNLNFTNRVHKLFAEHLTFIFLKKLIKI